jgi:hypothetical protein
VTLRRTPRGGFGTGHGDVAEAELLKPNAHVRCGGPAPKAPDPPVHHSCSVTQTLSSFPWDERIQQHLLKNQNIPVQNDESGVHLSERRERSVTADVVKYANQCTTSKACDK